MPPIKHKSLESQAPESDTPKSLGNRGKKRKSQIRTATGKTPRHGPMREGGCLGIKSLKSGKQNLPPNVIVLQFPRKPTFPKKRTNKDPD
jgi:hypothetical protein